MRDRKTNTKVITSDQSPPTQIAQRTNHNSGQRNIQPTYTNQKSTSPRQYVEYA